MQVIFVPEVTKEKYAELTGLTLDTVEGHIRRGYLKTIKRGKRRLIDLTSFISPEKINGENYESKRFKSTT